MWYYWALYCLAAAVIAIAIFKIYQKLSCGVCKSNIKLNGKTVIVTGANSGIGFETAKDLARRGARVILACRDERRGAGARDKIVRDSGNNEVVCKNLDLASLDSVRKFAEDILNTEKRLDVLVNNAGAISLGNKKTSDGIIADMQVNHFGPFLLTNLLVPILKRSAPSRIVTVSSVIHYIGRVDLNKINIESYYLDFLVYCNSKLCNMLFSEELSRRLRGSGVTSNSLHPGAVYTDIWRSTNWVTRVNNALWNRLLFKNAWEGAQTSIHCAVSPECEGVTGKYFADCHVSWKSWKVRDRELAGSLWDYSEKMVGMKFNTVLQKEENTHM